MRRFKSGREIREEKLRKANAKAIIEQMDNVEEDGTLKGICFRNIKGVCYLVANDPAPCRGICVNWRTFKRSKDGKGYMDWYDLIEERTSAFTHDNRVIQTTFGGADYEDDAGES